MQRGMAIWSLVSVALLVAISTASTVTLSGGCPLYVINQSRSYITFNVTNSGDGTASDMRISATFPGISAANSTIVIPSIGPNSSYSERFHLSNLVGFGSYAVNINATYVQSGSNYATVFPCIIYIGTLTGGPLFESVSVKGDRMSVNITNTEPQSFEAQVTAVVPPSFTVVNSTKAITVGADGHAGLYFDLVSPKYTDATFPVIGELSYEYNGTHYAQMASAALVFGSGASPSNSGGGFGIVGLILAVIIVAIVALIVVSLIVGRRRGANDAGQDKVSEVEK
jgi:hypothetical protein